MKEKHIDDIIKKGLEQFEADLSGMNWASFKDQLDFQVVDEDAAFDNHVSNSLNNYEVPYNASHWKILRDTLRRKKALRTAIFRLKSMELSIAVFLFFLFATYFNIDNNSVHNIHVAQTIHENSSSYSGTHAHNVDKKNNNAASQLALALSQYESRSTQNNSSKKATEKPIKTFNQIRVIEKPQAIRHMLFNVPFIYDQLKSNGILSTRLKDNDSEKKLEDPDIIASLIKPVVYDSKLEHNQEIKLLDKKAEAQKFIAVSGGITHNIIKSPYDPIYKANPYESVASNYQASFTYGKSWKTIEAFTGVKYGHLSYAPQEIEELYSFNARERKSYAIKLDKNEFDVVSIPVGVRANLINNDRHRVHAGISLNNSFIVRSDYDFSVYEYLNPSNTFSLDRVSPNSNLSRKPFPEGIIDGGSITDNYYLSASVGIGYNFKISSSLELTALVDYSHTTASNGIGPNRDLINGFSFDLGIRKNI